MNHTFEWRVVDTVLSRFKDWQGRNRISPLGSELKTAR